MARNKTRVAFIVYDYDKDLTDLSRLLALEATSFEKVQKGGIKPSRWELASGESESAELSKHLEMLLKQLSPRKDVIYELSKNYRCVVAIGIDYYEFNPEIVLQPDMLSALAALGVKLWFDIYNMWDGESDHNDHNKVGSSI